MNRLRSWWSSPWRPPRFLAIITAAYLLWSLLPVLVAVLFSFNKGRSRTVWQGFSMRWYYGDPVRSVWHDASLHTALTHTLWLGLLATVVTVPLGVAFALGIDRWRGRLPSGASFTMLLSFVLPETLMAVALLFVITQVVDAADTGDDGAGGRPGDLPAVLSGRHRALPAAHHRQAVRGGGVDLGASPIGAIRRVLLPMLVPAIFASTVLVFADVIDDFVIVRYLSGDSSTEPVSVKIYNTARAAPSPALNALATHVAGLLARRHRDRLRHLPAADPRRGLEHPRHRRLRRRALTSGRPGVALAEPAAPAVA